MIINSFVNLILKHFKEVKGPFQLSYCFPDLDRSVVVQKLFEGIAVRPSLLLKHQFPLLKAQQQSLDDALLVRVWFTRFLNSDGLTFGDWVSRWAKLWLSSSEFSKPSTGSTVNRSMISCTLLSGLGKRFLISQKQRWHFRAKLRVAFELKGRSWPVVTQQAALSTSWWQRYSTLFFGASTIVCINYLIIIRPKKMTPDDIYRVLNKNAVGIEGYDCPKFYHDPSEIIRNKDLLKSIAQNKVTKKRELKRGHFLEDHVKIYKSYPSPQLYQSFKPLEPPQNSLKYPRKLSLFDLIIKQNKKQKHPAVGQYNIIKTQEQLEKEKRTLKTKKVKSLDRLDPFENDLALSIMVPGPGTYNSKPLFPIVKQNPMKPEDWRRKHSTQKTSVEKLPPVGTYTPLVYNSFAKIQTETQTKRKYWGSEKRFKGLWESNVMSPGPSTYAQLSRELERLSKGIDLSIYQDD